MSDVNPCISEDIWFKILQELPVKTLGKCRCVCKSWHSLIVSPCFMAAHLKHYTQNAANSLLLYKEISQITNCPAPRQYEQCVFFRDVAQFKEGNSSLHTSVLPFMLRMTLIPQFQFVGSIHGLLCLYDDCNDSKSRVLLWNPLLLKLIKLPMSTATGEDCEVAFGYDSKKNDYRVVKISHLLDESSTSLLIEIYSVQEQTWREISGDYLVRNDVYYVSNQSCFLNGVIYWITFERTPEYQWLLLFDVSEETFDKMEFPDGLLARINGEFGVFEYKNRLSVSHCKYGISDGVVTFARCQIWVKEEYNVRSPWYKILNVEIHDCTFRGPIQYLGRNEELLGFAKKHTNELVAYDPKTRQTKGLGRHISSSITFSSYSESLVLLDQKLDTVDDAITDEELQRLV